MVGCCRGVDTEDVLGNGEDASVLDVFRGSIVVVVAALSLLVEAVGVLNTKVETRVVANKRGKHRQWCLPFLEAN